MAAPEMRCFDMFAPCLDTLEKSLPNELSTLSSPFQMSALKWT